MDCIPRPSMLCVRVVAFLVLGAAAALGASAGSSASAQARHERVEITPVREGGRTVGARIRLTLRPTATHQRARVVLGRADLPATYNNYQRIATHPTAGFLRLVLGEATGITAPASQTYELRYGDGNDLRPGERVMLATVWSTGRKRDAVHVWGMARTGVRAESVRLPE